MIYIKSKYFNNRLILFWKIGKKVFEEQNKVDNPVDKYSKYFQYKFVMTECFSRENINFMKKLYLYFPIFNSNLLKLEWGHYLILLRISNNIQRMFYYELTLFSCGTVFELSSLIDNCLYERI